jgi:hypothetical protein
MANYTDEQRAAYNAGIGYGYGKANKRVPIREDNKDSFRAGNDRARKKLGKPVAQEKPPHSREEKIQYYSGRVADPKLTKGQRDWAVKSLQRLTK